MQIAEDGYEPRWCNLLMVADEQTIQEHLIEQHNMDKTEVNGMTISKAFKHHDQLHDRQQRRYNKRSLQV